MNWSDWRMNWSDWRMNGLIDWLIRLKKQVILQVELIRNYRDKLENSPSRANQEQIRLVRPKDVMQGKLFQKCTHLLYCSELSLGGNVNTRRMSKPDMGFIFHIKKSMKYSGQRKLLCELSKLSKFKLF